MKFILFLIVTLNLSGCMVAAGLGSVALLEQVIPGKDVFAGAEADVKNTDSTEFDRQMAEFRRIQKLHAEAAKARAQGLESVESANSVTGGD